jgi:Recombination endonuclease VII
MEREDPPVKRCRDCGEDRPASEFWRRKQSPDGLALYCKACFGARNQAAAEARARAEGRTIQPRRPQQSNVPDGSKYCGSCDRVLPLEEFVRNRTTSSGYGSYCRPCQNAKSNESRIRLHGGARHYHLKRRYGIGADEVLEMLRRQWFHCPVCVCRLTLETAHVDHDHRTGQVRAVLCFNCNGGLGQFRDDPRVLRRAAAYLEGSEWQQTKPEPGGAYPRPISLPDPRPSLSSSGYTPPIFSLEGVRRLRPH